MLSVEYRGLHICSWRAPWPFGAGWVRVDQRGDRDHARIEWKVVALDEPNGNGNHAMPTHRPAKASWSTTVLAANRGPSPNQDP